MATPKIIINKQSGNLFRTSPNLDGVISLVYDGTKPTLYGSDTAKEVFSIRQAINAGVTVEDYPVLHYQLTEIFRINPNARISIAFGDITSAAVFNALRAFQPRQIGYYTADPLTATMVAAAQARATELEAAEAPASIIIGANTSAIATNSLIDLTGLQANKVSVVIGQGGAGSKAAALVASTGASVPALGTLLGRLSLCNVAENIGFVQNGNVAGIELQDVSLGNGTAFSDLTKSELDVLDDKGYIILMKYSNLDGTYFNGDSTCANDDLNRISLNRTLDKAIRAVRRALTPKLNSSVRLDEEGKIDQIYVTQYESLVNLELGNMQTNNEISQFDCTINPAQNIVEDETLEVDVAIVPFGTAKIIKINIGFQASVA